ncbi:MAG: fused MFS/spermidine synthase [Anaerolineae bacterium]|nr:fused MFS/spermidine synthase [Anaerolineae bacterium]
MVSTRLAPLIVFISNTCIMVLELVASRLIAPIVGVSLYTWTSIIGVLLAGISIGNFLGGKIADRAASPRVLGGAFVLAGLTSLGVLVLVEVGARMGLPPIPNVPLVVRMLLFVTMIFLLPSIMLGLISPIVIKLALKDLSHTGDFMGRIYAASTIGSIVGTFATGYWLISLFGTRPVLLGVGGVLVLMGVWLGQWTRQPVWPVLASVAVVAALVAVPFNNLLPRTCLVESNYYCIKVRDEVSNGITYKVLSLDHLVHSYNVIEDPLALRYSYEQVAAESAQYLVQRDGALNAFFIGGGGYTLPRYLETLYADSNIEVAEIDPMVTQTAYTHMGLSPESKIISHNFDARLYLKSLRSDQKFSFVLGDAFNDFTVPYHLTTKEFNDLVRQHLTDDGIYMLNLIDGGPLPFATAVMRTLKQTFPPRLLRPGKQSLPKHLAQHHVGAGLAHARRPGAVQAALRQRPSAQCGRVDRE